MTPPQPQTYHEICYPDQQAAYNEAPRLMQGTNIQNVEVDEMNPKRIPVVRSPTDTNWTKPLREQLWPQLKGHPTSGEPEADLKLLRKQVPVLTEEQLYKIFPNHEQSTITVVNPKTHTRHYVDLKKAATWILNAVQWFNIFEQPMMIEIWKKDWQDAGKFQCLLQILQINFHIPKWQIFVQDDTDFPKMIIKWRCPSTYGMDNQ